MVLGETDGADDGTLRLPQFPVSRLVGHDGPIPLVRFTGTYVDYLYSAYRQCVLRADFITCNVFLMMKRFSRLDRRPLF